MNTSKEEHISELRLIKKTVSGIVNKGICYRDQELPPNIFKIISKVVPSNINFDIEKFI